MLDYDEGEYPVAAILEQKVAFTRYASSIVV